MKYLLTRGEEEYVRYSYVNCRLKHLHYQFLYLSVMIKKAENNFFVIYPVTLNRYFAVSSMLQSLKRKHTNM